MIAYVLWKLWVRWVRYKLLRHWTSGGKANVSSLGRGSRLLRMDL
jgi:hypothetical protein